MERRSTLRGNPYRRLATFLQAGVGRGLAAIQAIG